MNIVVMFMTLQKYKELEIFCEIMKINLILKKITEKM